MPLQCPPRLLISIHPPRKGRDRTAPKSFPPLEEFQSTLPARGGTASKNPQKPAEPTFQSTLPARGGTGGFLLSIVVFEISIHPPRVGRDGGLCQATTRSAISIHPPRKGKDRPGTTNTAKGVDFNPPSPQGEGR